MKKHVLNAELNDKKATLKRVLDEDYRINSELLKGQGVHTKGDIVVALRKKAFSLKSFPAKQTPSSNPTMTERKPSNPLANNYTAKK